MIEIEMKFPVADFAAVIQRLEEQQAERHETRIDIDRYFAPPDRDFAKTDEAFRIRSIGERNMVTYKGPKLDAATKTREEIEVPFADGAGAAAQLEQMFTALRYRFVAVVEKTRIVYDFERDGYSVEATLDEVKNLGRFVELEIIADSDQLDIGRSLLQALAVELGLIDSERKSYLQLLLDKGNNEPHHDSVTKHQDNHANRK